MSFFTQTCCPGYRCHGRHFLPGRKIKLGPDSEAFSRKSQLLSSRFCSASIFWNTTRQYRRQKQMSVATAGAPSANKGYPEFRLE